MLDVPSVKQNSLKALNPVNAVRTFLCVCSLLWHSPVFIVLNQLQAYHHLGSSGFIWKTIHINLNLCYVLSNESQILLYLWVLPGSTFRFYILESQCLYFPFPFNLHVQSFSHPLMWSLKLLRFIMDLYPLRM